MESCLDLVAQAADSDASVLVTGETGTGKELFARAIHVNSSRANNNFVVVDCAALPETLVESVLFGHVKGAFTGADRDRDGLFKLADGGTLFLDEIGELSQGIQKTFLRVLQDGSFRPVGSKSELQSDFRLVAATNRDLSAMAAIGAFREDLLYRLRTIVITLPPLRERFEDIKPLAIHYMNRLCERYRLPTKGFSEEFFQAMAAYTWPGNVRDLFSTMERVLLQHRNEPVLYPMHLPDEIRIQVLKANAGGEALTSSGVGPVAADGLVPWKDYRRRALDDAERSYLRELLRASKGNVVRASRLSGLSPSRLYDLFRKYALPTRP
jgi:two-component system, NtrC family, response regulator